MNHLYIVFIATLCLISHFCEAQTLLLSDMDLSPVFHQYGIPTKNHSVAGEKLSVAGEIFTNGIGVQAACNMKFVLRKKTSRFKCMIGINDCLTDYKSNHISQIPLTDGMVIFYKQDSAKSKKQYAGIGNGNGSLNAGSVVFKVIGDGKELYNSGLIRTGEKTREISLDLSGIDILELITEDGGDGISGDHANWLNASFTYSAITPSLVSSDYSGTTGSMPPATANILHQKIAPLPTLELPLSRTTEDWLIHNNQFKSLVYQTHEGKDIVLTNGLVSRIFRVFPNLVTVDLVNQMNGENMLRAVGNEGILKIDGKDYPIGGLDGQEEFGYTQYHWLDEMRPLPNSFRITDFEISELKPRIIWPDKRWSLVKPGNVSGKVLTFYLEGPDALKGAKLKLHYAIYDGIPCISKWFELENHTDTPFVLDEFVLEQLAMAEPESPVEASSSEQFIKPNIHVESDWAFHGFTEQEAEHTEFWSSDKRYTSQCNYKMVTPCLLEIKLPSGPDETIAKGNKFESFRAWLMPFDSYDRERKGLFKRHLLRTIAPWTTQNPIFMHCTSADPQIVKNAIDQCAETGYEMVVLSFGTGLNMEDEQNANSEKFKELTDYAISKGIELGGYSLLASRWISDEVDIINPATGKRGGMTFGSSPCLCSEWGYEYFRKIKTFFEKTGMTVFENDGSYPGDVCASTAHAHHKGLKDSQWKQRQQIANLYQWMCENGIYTNIPDYGYMLNGGTKTGIGYREVNWSLPRERQLILGRQVMYDGLWDRLPSMCWTFVPLTQYHGGGKAATLEPLSEHLEDYKAHMMQNYGTGVQACYRGHRLYDTEETKQVVKETIAWYKQYREILNSEIIHLRRPDGKDYDGILHVNPGLKEKGIVMLYNPTPKNISRNIILPLYYTGLTRKAKISEQGKKSKTYSLNRNYEVEIQITIPARSYTWLVIQ